MTVGYCRPDGSIASAQARVLDFDDPENDDWLAVNQFTVSENRHTRLPDVVLFVTGLPVAVIRTCLESGARRGDARPAGGGDDARNKT